MAGLPAGQGWASVAGCLQVGAVLQAGESISGGVELERCELWYGAWIWCEAQGTRTGIQSETDGQRELLPSLLCLVFSPIRETQSNSREKPLPNPALLPASQFSALLLLQPTALRFCLSPAPVSQLYFCSHFPAQPRMQQLHAKQQFVQQNQKFFTTLCILMLPLPF